MISQVDYVHLVHDFQRLNLENNLMISYCGEVNQMVTKVFTSLAEAKLNERNIDKSTIKKVYHIMVESLQNIFKHAENLPSIEAKKASGVFILGENDEGFVVSTGNAIAKSNVGRIKEQIEHLNSLSLEEVQEMYKTQIREGVLSERGGAGLGFIDMARKSGSKLEFKFETIDEKNSFFILKTYIAK